MNLPYCNEKKPAVIVRQPRFVCLIIGIRFRIKIQPRAIMIRPCSCYTINDRTGYCSPRIAGQCIIPMMILGHKNTPEAFHHRYAVRIQSQDPVDLIRSNFPSFDKAQFIEKNPLECSIQ